MIGGLEGGGGRLISAFRPLTLLGLTTTIDMTTRISSCDTAITILAQPEDRF